MKEEQLSIPQACPQELISYQLIMNGAPMAGQGGNRWWEFYFIRYFVGSIVGAVVVASVLFSPYSSLAHLFSLTVNEIKEMKPEHFMVSGILGLTYCYISSAPMLVLHTFRAHFDFQRSLSKAGPLKVLLIIAISIGTSLWWVQQGENYYRDVGFLAVSFLVIYLQASIEIEAIWNKLDKVFNYYSVTTQARAVDTKFVKEYTESYRHLREHGNAFLIVLLEIALGGSLFVSRSANKAVALLVLWLLPSVAVWFVGTFLESKLGGIKGPSGREGT